MLPCEKCNGITKTIDSRCNNGKVKRRRECLKCGYRFTTYELPKSRLWSEKEVDTIQFIKKISVILNEKLESIKTE